VSQECFIQTGDPLHRLIIPEIVAMGFNWVILAISAVMSTARASEDIVSLVIKGDADALLQQVGHGVLADTPNGKGQLALVAAGTIKQKHQGCETVFSCSK
jgi:hypothetical protein